MPYFNVEFILVDSQESSKSFSSTVDNELEKARLKVRDEPR